MCMVLRTMGWVSFAKARAFCLLIALISSSPALGFNFPVMGPGENAHFLIDAESVKKLIIDGNYGKAGFDGGVCYGIDRLNFTLLSRVKFAEAAQADSDEIIFQKLVSAFEKSEDVTIFSTSASPTQFMQKMHERWREVDNPIKRAIEHIFNSSGNTGLSSKTGPMLQAMLGGSLTPPPYAFFRPIKDGIPVGIGIISGSRSRHALTVYGYKHTGKEEPLTFYVLDSNNPGGFWELVFRGKEGRRYWYYEPWKSKVDIVIESMSDMQELALKGRFPSYSISGPASCPEMLEKN